MFKGMGFALLGSEILCLKFVNGVTIRSQIHTCYCYTVADPGFLERWFICIKVWWSLCGFYLIFLKYPMKMK